MAKVYKVYIVEENRFFSSHSDRQQAIADAQSLCTLDHFSGKVEVHELDEADTQLVNPVTVYECNG